MVRDRARERGETSIWEHRVPIEVDQTPVKPNQGWGCSFVAPGVGTIDKRDVNEFQGVDRVVEHVRFMELK